MAPARQVFSVLKFVSSFVMLVETPHQSFLDVDGVEVQVHVHGLAVYSSIQFALRLSIYSFVQERD